MDKELFSVTEGIIYEIIHNRHKYQREEHLKKQQSEKYQDDQNRRKHLNSRRNDVSNEPVLFSFFLLFLLFIIINRNG